MTDAKLVEEMLDELIGDVAAMEMSTDSAKDQKVIDAARQAILDHFAEAEARGHRAGWNEHVEYCKQVFQGRNQGGTP